MLRIRNWDKHYETNRTRVLKNLSWIALPVALDSDGYAEVMEHENGAAHFGVFVAMLEVAARCVPRGCLMRARNVPHDAVSLARMCRIPAPKVQEAIDRLLSIGWIETWHQPGTEVPEKGREMGDTLHYPTGITQQGLPNLTDKTSPTEPGEEGNGEGNPVENVGSAENPPGSPSGGATGLSGLKKMPRFKGEYATETLRDRRKRELAMLETKRDTP